MLEVKSYGAGENGRLDVAAEGDHVIDRHRAIDAADILLDDRSFIEVRVT